MQDFLRTKPHSSNSLFASPPNKPQIAHNAHLFVFVQTALGDPPLDLLNYLTDFTMNSPGTGAPQRVDLFGKNLQNLSKSESAGSLALDCFRCRLLLGFALRAAFSSAWRWAAVGAAASSALRYAAAFS